MPCPRCPTSSRTPLLHRRPADNVRVWPCGASLIARLSSLPASSVLAGCAGSEQTGAPVPGVRASRAGGRGSRLRDADDRRGLGAVAAGGEPSSSGSPGTDERSRRRARARSSVPRGLDWETDVAPALGPEVVLVVTADTRMIVLLEPESEAKLDALLAKTGAECRTRGDRGPCRPRREGGRSHRLPHRTRARHARGGSGVPGRAGGASRRESRARLGRRRRRDGGARLRSSGRRPRRSSRSASTGSRRRSPPRTTGCSSPSVPARRAAATPTTSRCSSIASRRTRSPRSRSAARRARSTASRARSTWARSPARSRRPPGSRSTASSTRSRARACSTCGPATSSRR